MAVAPWAEDSAPDPSPASSPTETKLAGREVALVELVLIDPEDWARKA